MKKINKYTILMVISGIVAITCFAYLVISYKHLIDFTPKKSDNSKESIVDTIDWFNARWTTPDLGVSQYKGEELEHLDRSQFVDIMDLPYGIYKDINTEEIVMNLDDVFPFVDNDADPSTIKNCQERFIDEDYINKYYDDYGHHATELFLNYFFNFDKADRIIIGGRTLKFDHYDTADAPIESWEVFLDETGEEQHYDSKIEFLTCIYNSDLPIADRRYIAYMKELNFADSTPSEDIYDNQEIEKSDDVIEIDVYPHENDEIVKMNSKTVVDHPIIDFLKDNLFLIICCLISIVSIVYTFVIIFKYY